LEPVISSSLCRFRITDEHLLSDKIVKEGIARAFGENRCFEFYLDGDIVRNIRGGDLVEFYRERFIDLRNNAFDTISKGDQTVKGRLLSDIRLSTRLISSMVFAHRAAITQIMVLGQIAPEPLIVRLLGADHLEVQRPERGQVRDDRLGPQSLKPFRAEPWTAHHRRSLARRQCNQTTLLKLQQQGPSGHVLEPAGAVAPIPSHTELTGKPRPIQVGMGLQPLSNQRDILRAQRPPLNDQLSVHWPNEYTRRKMRPEKKSKKIQSAEVEGIPRSKTRLAHHGTPRFAGSK